MLKGLILVLIGASGMMYAMERNAIPLEKLKKPARYTEKRTVPVIKLERLKELIDEYHKELIMTPELLQKIVMQGGILENKNNIREIIKLHPTITGVPFFNSKRLLAQFLWLSYCMGDCESEKIRNGLICKISPYLPAQSLKISKSSKAKQAYLPRWIIVTRHDGIATIIDVSYAPGNHVNLFLNNNGAIERFADYLMPNGTVRNCTFENNHMAHFNKNCTKSIEQDGKQYSIETRIGESDLSHTFIIQDQIEYMKLWDSVSKKYGWCHAGVLTLNFDLSLREKKICKEITLMELGEEHKNQVAASIKTEFSIIQEESSKSDDEEQELQPDSFYQLNGDYSYQNKCAIVQVPTSRWLDFDEDVNSEWSM